MAIELNQVKFSYPKTASKLVIDIDNWSVKDQQKCFLYGPSGTGKSTLLKILSGLNLPTSGSVEILGERLDKLSSNKRDKFRANNLGYIFQQFNLIDYLDAIDNVKLANHFSSAKQKANSKIITNLLSQLNIQSDDWHRPVHQLSVGQQQRIAIARAFINQPKLIIADEPTSALDNDVRNRFIQLLGNLCDNFQTTLLFVSHDTQLTPHFNQVQALNEINHVKGNH